MFLFARPIGWLLRRYAYRWFALACGWLVILVLLFPLLWLAQQASDAGGWELGVAVFLIEMLFLGAAILLVLVASVFRLVKSVCEALGLGSPKPPKLLDSTPASSERSGSLC